MALVYFVTIVILMTKMIEFQGVSAGSECSRYTVLNTADRDQARQRGHVLKCDRNDLTKKWYRFTGAAGSALPTTCVAKNHCGTHAPGWMQGSHPTQAQGIVTRRVCYHWLSNCCQWHNNIRVRNCGGFYVYELDKPPHCHLRYCGNGQDSFSCAGKPNGNYPDPNKCEGYIACSNEITYRMPCPTAGLVWNDAKKICDWKRNVPSSPCNNLVSECNSYTVLNQADRSSGFYQKHVLKCDRNDLTKKWYRFSGAAGSALPTTCVAKNRCGTHAPGWMQGSHPTQAQGIVTRRVCYHWLSNCCQWHNNIRVRNCGGFYVYELDKPPHCHLRYCGSAGRAPTVAPPVAQECKSYTVLNTADRAQGFSSNRVLKCDKNELSKKWYRFTGAAGSAMPTSCVPKNRCGTHAPGWMEGSHPTQAQGIVTRKVCYHWGSKCCNWHNMIRVRNCGGFYVYELDRTPQCHLRYCGNAGGIAPTAAPPQPPECRSYTVLNQADRAKGFSSNRVLKCDRNDLTKKWYRFSGSAGSTLPTTCVAKNHCGTHAPGWMQGSHPTQAQGIVTRKVCYHWVSNCCHWSNNIRVRNCGGFYVYELDKPPHCHLRYCGSAGPAPTAHPPVPQECRSYTVLNQADRAKGFSSNRVLKCDRNDLTKKWYRFSGSAGSTLPTSCVAKNHCGTHAPGWMQGSHPTQAQGIVTRKVCYHWVSNCCHWSNNIRVRNCGGFYVYELNKPPHCHLRYCGSAGPAPTAQPPLPQECRSYSLLNEADRAQGFISNRVLKCDKIGFSKKWYRFSGAAGTAIASSCVPKNRCGTHATGWMEGSHPTQAQGIVTRRVCFSWNSKCCYWNANIRVRNCGAFYVYELDKTRFCHLRYCGNGGPAPTTAPPIPTTMPNPCLSRPCINGGTCVSISRNAYTCVCAQGFTGKNCEQDVNECLKSPCRNGATCRNTKGGYTCQCATGFQGKNCDTDVDECRGKPCRNGGTCQNKPGSYFCFCPIGFLGKNCETDINECSRNPCQNGGSCRNTNGGYTCSCRPGYQGKNCEQDVNECLRNPCRNGGSCRNTNGGYTCTCRSGYQGKNCEQDVNECLKNPCRNGGSCRNTNGGYTCTCRSGYQGKNCEQDVNECLNNPCRNGGSCRNTNGGYTCTCRPGYQGKNCERDVNECLKNPCRNGGSCRNTNGGYTCVCRSGFQGKNCERDVNECLRNPCRNGGSCRNTNGGYRCTCRTGFQGKNCEQDVNECLRNPCQNGGSCRNTNGGYTCTCRSGYQGKNCEQDVNECMKSPCQNGGSCRNTNGGYTCICTSGYQGKNCDQDVNECLKNPCQNGGSCSNTNGGYTCKCTSGYQGKNCQQDVDECLKNPCQNGGSCLNKPGSYSCECSPGFQGNNCEQDINECLKSPCRNGGTCSNTNGGYTCTCMNGFEGNDCETDVNECLKSPCQNGGTCRNTNGGYSCVCVSGFRGVHCEQDVDECVSGNPCNNGATCTNKVGGYTCKCTSGFTGKDCDQDVDECAINPCQNGGKCINTPGSYRCQCLDEFTGKHCESEPSKPTEEPGQADYSAIGCYKDHGGDDRPFPNLVVNLRPGIDWNDLKTSVIDKCANAVKASGYKYFGIQFYGECWSGPDASVEYDKHGISNECYVGVGAAGTNQVYQIV